MWCIDSHQKVDHMFCLHCNILSIKLHIAVLPIYFPEWKVLEDWSTHSRWGLMTVTCLSSFFHQTFWLFYVGYFICTKLWENFININICMECTIMETIQLYVNKKQKKTCGPEINNNSCRETVLHKYLNLAKTYKNDKSTTMPQAQESWNLPLWSLTIIKWLNYMKQSKSKVSGISNFNMLLIL